MSSRYYGGQASRRVLFLEDDTKNIISLLASARLSSDEEDDDTDEEREVKNSLRARKENVPDSSMARSSVGSIQSETSSPTTRKGLSVLSTNVRLSNSSAGEKKFVLGGSSKRVERYEETPRVLPSSLWGSAGGRAERLSSGSMQSNITHTGTGTATHTISSQSGGPQPVMLRRLIKTPVYSSPKASSSPASSLLHESETKRDHNKTSSRQYSPAPSVTAIGWSPEKDRASYALSTSSVSIMSSPNPNQSDDSYLTLRDSSMISSASPSTESSRLMNEKDHEKDYEYMRVIGKGSFGKVLLAKVKSSKELVAIKVLDRKKLLERGNLRRAHSEVRCLQKSSHRFIVGLKSAFETKSRIFIVQDFCVGGELFSLLARFGRLSLDATRFYGAQCAAALDHLHKARFAYRDLKTENIMLDCNGNVRLVDFGLVKEGVTAPERGARSFVGTTEYISPEILLRRGHGFAVDWWALGIVLHELIVGLPPWYSSSSQEMHRRVLYDPLVLDSEYLDETAKSTISALLDKNPLRRLGSANGLEAVQKSPFFQELNWDKLTQEQLRPPFRPDLDHESDLRYFSEEFLDLPIEL